MSLSTMTGELFILNIVGSSPPRWGLGLTHRTSNGCGLFIADGCPNGDIMPLQLTKVEQIATTSKPGQILDLFGDLPSDSTNNKKFVAEALRKLKNAGHIHDDVCQRWTLRLTSRLSPVRLHGVPLSPADLYAACLTSAELRLLRRVQSKLSEAGLILTDMTAVGLCVGPSQLHTDETGMSLADVSIKWVPIDDQSVKGSTLAARPKVMADLSFNWVPIDDQSVDPSTPAFYPKIMGGPRINALKEQASRRNAPGSIAPKSDISQYLTSFSHAPVSAFSPVAAHSLPNSPTIGPSPTYPLMSSPTHSQSRTRPVTSLPTSSPSAAQPPPDHPRNSPPYSPAHSPAHSPTHHSVIRPVAVRLSQAMRAVPPGAAEAILAARNPRSVAGPSGPASAALLARDPRFAAGLSDVASPARSFGDRHVTAVSSEAATAARSQERPHSAAHSLKEPRLAAVAAARSPRDRHFTNIPPGEPALAAVAAARSPRDRHFTNIPPDAILEPRSLKMPESAAVPSEAAVTAHSSGDRRSTAGKDSVVHSHQRRKRANDKSRGTPPALAAIDLLKDPRLAEDSSRPEDRKQKSGPRDPAWKPTAKKPRS